MPSVAPLSRNLSASIAIEDHLVVHSLGLSWRLNTDTFEFSVNPTSIETLTKRRVLSSIAKLFDPLRLISPVIISAKILMQELWTLKLGWDDPPTITTRWILFFGKSLGLISSGFSTLDWIQKWTYRRDSWLFECFISSYRRSSLQPMAIANRRNFCSNHLLKN